MLGQISNVHDDQGKARFLSALIPYSILDHAQPSLHRVLGRYFPIQIVQMSVVRKHWQSPMLNKEIKGPSVGVGREA